MKLVSLKLGTLALAASAALFAAPTQASAAVINVQIGAPPPAPVAVERPWARPYRGAVWIAPHYEAVRGAWVWVHGYYAYPPHRGAAWIPGHYRHGYWYPGHWA